MINRIFVVDDERYVADMLAEILRKSGYEACAFYDAESALKRAEVSAPELVIIDVVLPGINGVEMAVLIRKRYPACRMLVFSGQGTGSGSLEKVRRHGYDFRLLTKPIHPVELLAIVERLNYEPEAA